MAIIISMICGDKLYNRAIDEKETVTFGSGNSSDVFVPDLQGSQHYEVALQNGKISLKIGGSFSIIKENVPLGTVLPADKNGQVFFMFFDARQNNVESVVVPNKGRLSLGRVEPNDIIVSMPFISKKSILFMFDNGNVVVQNQSKTNPLFKNNKTILKSILKDGDVLNIFAFQITYSDSKLFFENFNDSLEIIESVKKFSKAAEQTAAKGTSAAKKKELDPDRYLTYHRSPRVRSKLPHKDILISNPPAAAAEYDENGNLLGLINFGTMMATNALYSLHSPALMALRSTGSIAGMMASKKQKKKMKEDIETYNKERVDKYTEYLEEQKEKIEQVADIQREIITEENPDPAECSEYIIRHKRNLWERMPSDDDFLNIRMGMGYDDLCVNIRSRAEAKGFKMESDAMEELCEQIAEEYQKVDQIPARVNFREYPTIGIVGNRKKVLQLVRDMLVSITALHAAGDVRIAGIFNNKERNIWAPLRWLPHVWDDNHQFRYLALDERRAHELCEILKEIAARRAADAADNNDGRKKAPLPHYVLIFGDRDMTAQEPVMEYILRNQQELGITTLFLFDDMYWLPQECQYIIDVNGIDENGQQLAFGFDKTDYGNKDFFEPDDQVTGSGFDALCRRLAAIKLDSFSVKNSLPGSVTFLEGYGVKTPEELNIAARWKQNSTADSMAVPVGMTASGKPFMLDIHSRAHGAHGLIAGTTGSGKSELIQSWILSLAVNYHPNEVNFVIIDYKGGSMAQLLEPLPHVVNKITNIDSNINRALVSIDAEIRRREHMLAEQGVKSVSEYQRLFKSGMVDKPMPHLIIVSDEFAELKKSEPEFMDTLTSFARVGRSLGIHLVLSTQKPTGIVNDQIDSNSRFRICLKVNNVSDSREIIKSPDAATITQIGRAYVKVGNNEIYELVQSFYSGAEYKGTAAHFEDAENKVRVIDVNGRRVELKHKKKGNKGDDELKVISDHIRDIASMYGVRAPKGLWCPELPEYILLDELETANGSSWKPIDDELKIPAGMFDKPEEQSQGTQYIDFNESAHYAVYGAPLTGKTMFLKTLMYSMIRSYSPEDISIYGVDFGGRSMASFEGFPHVGGIVLDYEEEKFHKLHDMLVAEIEYRKHKFQSSNVSSMSGYRRFIDRDLPEIFLLIDNVVTAIKTFPEMEDLLVKITGEGATYGIHLVFTAANNVGIGYKITAGIKSAIAFQLNDSSDYPSLVGKPAVIPSVTGRAVISNRPDRPILFQSAVYMNDEDGAEGREKLKQKKEEITQEANGLKAKPIPVLPDKVKASDLIGEYKYRDVVPAGIRYDNCEPAFIELIDRYHAVITGAAVNDTRGTLKNIIEILMSRRDNEVYIFDSKDKSMAQFADRAAGYVSQYDGQILKDNINALIDALGEREDTREERMNKEGAAFDSSRFIMEQSQLCIIINDLPAFVDGVEDNVRDYMNKICRCSKGLGVICIATAGADRLSELSQIEPLTKTFAASQNGILVSGSPALCSCFKNTLTYDEKKTSFNAGEAMIFNNGRTMKIRPMK